MPSRCDTLSLHDALPISRAWKRSWRCWTTMARSVARRIGSPCTTRSCSCGRIRIRTWRWRSRDSARRRARRRRVGMASACCRRSEEHTSELQSLRHLVCRRDATPFPYTTLFRSRGPGSDHGAVGRRWPGQSPDGLVRHARRGPAAAAVFASAHGGGGRGIRLAVGPAGGGSVWHQPAVEDRKSTRLNSSHLGISYAVAMRHPFPTRRSSDLEGLEAIMALLDDDGPVSRQTDWFAMHDAVLQLRPYSHPHMEVAVAGFGSPSGPQAAGRYGISLLSKIGRAHV